MLRRSPEAFLAWEDHRWGIFAPGDRAEPDVAEAFWVDITADPRTSARYHWRRMFGCAVGILAFAILGTVLAALSRWRGPLRSQPAICPGQPSRGYGVRLPGPIDLPSPLVVACRAHTSVTRSPQKEPP